MTNATTINPINELKDEHQAVKLTLRILGEISTRLMKSEKVGSRQISLLII